MNIGKAIKLCRTQKNLRQSELARLSNISVSYLSLLEQGKRDPNFSKLRDISFALNIPISILVFLATDYQDLKEINPEVLEKLSYTTLSLIKALADETAVIS